MSLQHEAGSGHHPPKKRVCLKKEATGSKGHQKRSPPSPQPPDSLPPSGQLRYKVQPRRLELESQRMDSVKQVTTNHIAPGESTTLLKLMSRKYFVDVRSGAAVTEHWLWWIQASPTAWCCLPATRSGVKRELMQCNERSWPEQARALDGSIALTAPNYDRPISRPPYPKLDPLAAAANDPRL